MVENRRTIASTDRNFVFPCGSQVVLQTNIKTESGFRKPGTVGVVVQSPSSNDATYDVQFSNGEVVAVHFEHLTLRRQEIDVLLDDSQWEISDSIIYRCRVGSRAFGLSHVESDDDLRGIFLPSAHVHWSLRKIPEQVERIEDGVDEVYWELEKFVRLALKANPNILETLWTPDVLFASPVAIQIREIRDAFLSKHVYKTYSGYVLSQFRKMKKRLEHNGTFKNKHAMHLIRLLFSGIHAVRTGEIMVDVSDHRTELLAIRNGEIPFEDIARRAHQLDAEFSAAFEKTDLPDQPDLETIDQFLIDARRSVVD